MMATKMAYLTLAQFKACMKIYATVLWDWEEVTASTKFEWIKVFREGKEHLYEILQQSGTDGFGKLWP